MEVVAIATWCLVVWGARAVGAQTPATMGAAGLTPMVHTQQSLQSALFSIDERLRALDSYYSIRYGGRWDVETYVRRLESIETRIGRVETLLELRTDKLLEAITSYQMKDTQTKEHINRKIDSLYDRLIHRIAYMENRIDTDVAKIQSSIESGFVRISRAERDSEIADVETQLHELQRQFEEFERNQNQTLTLLVDTFARRSTAVLNDDGGRDVDQVAASVDNVAAKVNKMFNDLSHQSQTLEGLVKNSMSLTNATRREIQEGFKTLGHRKIVMQQGNKQNKEKEAATSLEGWDALSNLLSKEFGNLVRKIDSNYEELTKDHTAFIDGCHRVQENESQLEAEIAAVLERILDRIHNRSHDMEKQVVALQEMLKSHNSNVIRTIGHSTNTAMQSSQYAKQLEATILQAVGQHKGLEKLGEGLSNVLEGIKVLQNQLGESPPVSVASENIVEACPKNCPDDVAIAEQILTTILHRNSTSVVGGINTDTASAIIADKILSTLKCTQTGTHQNTEMQPSTPDLSAITEAHIERIIERTLEVYKNNSNVEESKTHDHDFTEDKGEKHISQNSQVDIAKSSSERQASKNATDNCVRTNSHTTEAINNNGKVLDIPANEEHVGETLEYNVTSDDAPMPLQSFEPNTNESAPQVDVNNVRDNQTVTEKVTTQETSEHVERGEAEPNHRTNATEDDATAREEESESGKTGEEREPTVENTLHLDEEGAEDLFPLNENGTEMPSDYDFEKTSSELDRSEQLYYDEMPDGAFDEENTVRQAAKTSEVGQSESNATETPHPSKTTSMSGLDDHGGRQTLGSDALSAQRAIESGFEVSVQILKTINSSVGITSIRDTAWTMNTTEDDSLNRAKNNSDNTVDPTDKLFNQTRTNTSTQGETENTAGDSQTSDPLFSKFWHRVISVASSNESAENTRSNLSRNINPDKTEPGEPKGQGAEGNVSAENVNVTDNHRDIRDETNDLDSEREPGEEMHDDLFEEFGSDVPPSR